MQKINTWIKFNVIEYSENNLVFSITKEIYSIYFKILKATLTIIFMVEQIMQWVHYNKYLWMHGFVCLWNTRTPSAARPTWTCQKFKKAKFEYMVMSQNENLEQLKKTNGKK